MASHVARLRWQTVVVISMVALRPGRGQLKAKSAADKRLGDTVADPLSHAGQPQEGVLRGG
jgi:hypothetical protein